MGQIIKRGDKFKAVVSVTQAHQRRRISRTFDRKSEARDWITATEEQKRKGYIYTYSEQDLPNYFEDWFETYKKPTINGATTRRYQATINVAKRYWKNRSLKSITFDDYQKFLNQLAEKYKISTVRKIHIQIRAAVTKAFQLHKIRDNFTDGAQVSGLDGKDATLKYLELDDITNLKKYCLKNINSIEDCGNVMILTSLLTGIRYEEATGLTWNHLDLAKAQMSIKQAYDYVEHHFITTKTPSSIRDITLSSDLVSALKKWRLITHEFEVQTQFRNADNFVFFTKRKKIMSNNGLNKRLKNLAKTHVIHKPITYHGLRHSHASFLIAKGISMQYISKRLGHQNIAITEQVYAHFLKEAETHQDKMAMKALNEI